MGAGGALVGVAINTETGSVRGLGLDADAITTRYPR